MMSWRFVRVLAALVTICSFGILVSGAAADAATGNPAIANVSPIAASASATDVGTVDGPPSPFGPSPVHWAGGQSPHVLGPAAGADTQDSLASTNWAGYIASGTTFTGVSGTWNVPSIVASQPAQYAAQWVGIDGVLSSDLIQTGTGETTSGGTTSYDAWIELLPANEVEINAPVAPGDVMAAMVTEGSPEVGRFTSRTRRKAGTTRIHSPTRLQPKRQNGSKRPQRWTAHSRRWRTSARPPFHPLASAAQIPLQLE